MEDKEMIEEMSDIIFKSKYKNYYTSPLKGANELYNAGYRKLPEGSVVLSREEYERLNECYKVRAFNKLRAENKQLKDRIAELQEDKEKWQIKAVFLYQMANSYGIECIIDSDIDETLKEIINKTNRKNLDINTV